MRVRRCSLLTVLVVTWTAAPSEAQWVATPYIGINIAGDAEHSKGGPGGSISYVGARLGFEFDVERYQHFFKDGDLVDLIPDPRADFDSDAVSVMGNVLVPIHIHGATKWRPYGTAGLGVIRAWLDSTVDRFDIHQNNLGFNVGGGVMYSLSRRLGLRGDVRYFRALVDEGKREGAFRKDYGFWRTSIGFTFGSPRKRNSPPSASPCIALDETWRNRRNDWIGALRVGVHNRGLASARLSRAGELRHQRAVTWPAGLDSVADYIDTGNGHATAK